MLSKEPLQKIIALIDMDYFYAQCEQIRNPLLKGKPVVVIMPSLRSGFGVVATTNYLARSMKIRSGMPVALAKKLSDFETIFINADKKYYQEVSEKVFEILDSLCEKVEQVSIDEAYFELTNPQDFIFATEHCKKIKKMIFLETGLTCSIGVSVNKFLAKIASNIKKPDGLNIIKNESVNSFLLKQKIQSLPGVGPKTEKIFLKNGIKTVGDLKKMSLDELVSLFGEAKGKQLFYFSRGQDNREIMPNREKQQLSRMITLEKDSNDYDFLSKKADFLSERVFHAVKISEKNFKTVSIIIGTSEIQTIIRSKTIHCMVLSIFDLKQMVNNLLIDFLKEGFGKVRRLGVKVSNFDEEKGQQKRLFEF
jgi:DNA polymerase IV (archaeal DinB-like DNA polymerase)